MQTKILTTRFIAVIFTIHASYVAAGMRDLLAGIFHDRVTCEITVVDEQNIPVSGATLWELTQKEKQKDIDITVMKRIVRRYEQDADFVLGRNTPHSSLLVRHSDENGKIFLNYERGDLRGFSSTLPVSFAVLKRGYESETYFREFSFNETHEVQVRVRKKENAVFDKRLLEIDNAYATIAQNNSDGVMGKNRMKSLLKQEELLRALASSLVQEGNEDLASVIYYNLAYLPSVDIFTNDNGEVIVRGYTNSYDENSPKRKRDMERALSLNESNPIIRYEKLFSDFANAAGKKWRMPNNQPELRKRLIQNTEEYFRNYPERMWPWPYRVLWQAYKSEGKYDKACETIQRFYKLEPTYYDQATWDELGMAAKDDCIVF